MEQMISHCLEDIHTALDNNDKKTKINAEEKLKKLFEKKVDTNYLFYSKPKRQKGLF